MLCSDVCACVAGFEPSPPPQDLQLKCDAGGLFFQWRAVAGAKHYRYRLIAENGKRLLQSRSTETSVHLGAGDPGRNYTARVRVKTKGDISEWASVTVKCPAPAPVPAHSPTPPPAPLVSISFFYIGRDTVIFDWNWKRLPAAAKWIYISIRPDDDENCDGRTEQYHALEEGKGSFSYASLCPDTSHHVEFAVEDKAGYLSFIKKERFRTLP